MVTLSPLVSVAMVSLCLCCRCLQANVICTGMPRILLSTAHITPLILQTLAVKFVTPPMLARYPPLPQPFQVTRERIDRLLLVDVAAHYESQISASLKSSKEPFCNDVRSRPKG
jgi:hypothetical protein